MSATVPKFNQPIQYTYEHSVVTAGGVRKGVANGTLPPEQNSFYLNPGEKLTLSLPETPDAGQQWNATAPQPISIKDLGYQKNGDPKAEGGSGSHSFLLQASTMLPAGGTPVHFVLHSVLHNSDLAEKNLRLTAHFDLERPMN